VNVSSPAPSSIDLDAAAQLDCTDVLASLGSSPAGLTAREAAARLASAGRNELQSHVMGPLDVLIGQVKNPLLILLAATAGISIVLHDATDATIILAIIVLSVGLGFINEFRAQRALADLHAQIRRTARVVRDGASMTVPVVELVVGDVVVLGVGDIVPADVRLLECRGLTCDEAVITGESLPADKTAAALAKGAGADLGSCVLMGTVVRAGAARGVVVATGAATRIGTIAKRLGTRLPETTFQHGLRDFSSLLVWITAIVTLVVFPVLAVVHHSFFESLLFALAIAVSLTPQLLPAIVTVSLATGARNMARKSVLVKRLVSIEDLGNMTVLFTDKTGTLTEGKMGFADALDVRGRHSDAVLQLGITCTRTMTPGSDVSDGNVVSALDAALLAAPWAKSLDAGSWRLIDAVPFDYERRCSSVLVDDGKRRLIVTKGAPESVVAACSNVPADFDGVLRAQFAGGARVIAVASREAPGMTTIGAQDEHGFTLAGLLTFNDPPKADAADSIARLQKLGITLKIITGDNELVAQKICRDLAIPIGATLNGAQLTAMSDQVLTAALGSTTIFARIAPDQKARLIKLQLATGDTVGFLGDGVNDAIALHDADVGISVESATDVAKDAADIVLVTKDLGILADGVSEGRRIFANTIKYVLMATSSNFGNTLSTAVGSLILPFLPMLPSQILLNNLLYDMSEMTIPTDNVDEEALHRPAHWDMGLIRRFMLVFGPLSSLADMAIFSAMLLALHFGPIAFRSGYFLESFVTQTLIIFAIRTRRVPFLRSRASRPLTLTTIGVAIVGAALPFSPLAAFFGFTPLPAMFFGVLAPVALAYVILVEFAKKWFFRHDERKAAAPKPHAQPARSS
jgi:Mg2+-importing ATPase